MFTENNLSFNLPLQDVCLREPCCKVHPYVTLKCTYSLGLSGGLLSLDAPCLHTASFPAASPAQVVRNFWLCLCYPQVPGVLMADACPDPACTGQEGAQSCLLGLCAESEWMLQQQKEAEATHLNYFSCCSDHICLEFTLPKVV